MSATRFIPVIKSRVAPSIAPRVTTIRSISSTASYQKGPVDATKDTLKQADRIVSDATVKGIDKGEQAKNKLKDAMGATGQDAKGKMQEAKGEAAQYAGEGKGKAEHMAGKAKGKASEAMGEAAGKAKEAKEKHLG
ncbi:hypothetical protein N7509_008630 [Penicillium cosmopolitanum]|uniref:LEA domain protein n=1 Tax=Penicillium cosmopolitanum TaxID=1131564 RepID=A0A9X0B2U8_9EURO|nr:uncharacterized protein N7509_008630 [Penicillium cosmopolitanum]KAJ5386089.1 hypothetical protein N7509_008630 [Penicillium cosmopolitanum]